MKIKKTLEKAVGTTLNKMGKQERVAADAPISPWVFYQPECPKKTSDAVKFDGNKED